MPKKAVYKEEILPEKTCIELEEKLSVDEMKIIDLWLSGETKVSAWATIIRPDTEMTRENERTFRTLSSRFWNKKSMVEAVKKIEPFLPGNKKVDRCERLRKPEQKKKSEQPKPVDSGNTKKLQTLVVPPNITYAMVKNLSPNEVDVIKEWFKGKTRVEAWVNIMRPDVSATYMNERSLRSQATRFWGTVRIKKIMAMIDEWGKDPIVKVGLTSIRIHSKVRPDVVYSDPSDYVPTSGEKSFDDIAVGSEEIDALDDQQDFQDESDSPVNDASENKKSIPHTDKKPSIPQTIAKKRSYAEQRQAWLESFQDIENPSATTPYGIGLWLGSRVLAQVNKREQWIERHNISPMDKDGCPYTSTDISAVKTVLAALLPFAPAPTQQELKQLTTAGLIISLTAEEMGINPDEYVAPTPPGVKSRADEIIDVDAETQSEEFDDE